MITHCKNLLSSVCWARLPCYITKHTVEKKLCHYWIISCTQNKCPEKHQIWTQGEVKMTHETSAFVRRNLQISQHHIKTNAYFTLVWPQVKYAAMVWDPYTKENIQKIEMVQRCTAWYVCKNNAREEGCVTEMLQQLGWRSLLQRWVDISLVFLYKCVHGLVAVDISDDLIPKTRHSRHSNSMSYNIPVETKTYIQNSFLHRTITQWNHLPESVVTSSSLDTFKEGVSGITH